MTLPSVNVVDYFVTLGVSDQLAIDYSGEGYVNFDTNGLSLWNRAITDIVVVDDGKYFEATT
jgi:hypothetical protein